MADIKRKIYFTKLQFRKMLSHEEETDIGIINSVFSRYADAYYQAESSGDYSNFVVKNKNTDEIFAVTRLHFEGNVLCGIVGRYATRIKGFLRETDIKTFSTKEIEPSSPESRFEIYSYFAIVPHLLKIAYLSDTSISSNIPRMVLDILRSNNGDGIYEVELTQLVDSDIKDKLKKMEGKIRVKGWIEGQEDAIAGGMQSLRSLETVFGSKITAKIRLTAGVSKRFTDDDIDEIIKLCTVDSGYSTICFEEEQDEEKEIVDVIKKQVAYTNTITLTPEEIYNEEVIWRKLCESLARK